MKNTLKLVIALCFTTLAFSLNAQQAINGIWNTGQDNTLIEIKEKNGSYEGRVFSSDNNKAVIGNLFVKEVKSVSGKWKGKLYSPKKQEWFDAVFLIKGEKLTVTVKSGLMSKTVEWTKK